VSSVPDAKQIFGGAATKILANSKSGTSIIADARSFVGAIATARRILQHSVGFDGGFEGLE